MIDIYLIIGVVLAILFILFFIKLIKFQLCLEENKWNYLHTILIVTIVIFIILAYIVYKSV
jgi:hypothetical protein